MKNEQHLNGMLNLLKPPGMTSALAVGVVRRLFGGAKVGHAGTLDPQAAGVLPLMLGKATRLFDYMQDKQKEYVAEVAFGTATDTQDAQGVVTEVSDRYPTEAALREALPRFVGQGMQRPPMFSALKQDGQRMYDLARRGEQRELPPRPVTVYALEEIAQTANHGAVLRVSCAKGFYVRTLCHDLGQALDCPAHMRFLLRTRSGVFTLGDAVTLEELSEHAARGTLAQTLQPMDIAVRHLPQAELPNAWLQSFRHGTMPPLQALPELRDTLEERNGAPFRLTWNGQTVAICERAGHQARLRTWLMDELT